MTAGDGSLADLVGQRVMVWGWTNEAADARLANAVVVGVLPQGLKLESDDPQIAELDGRPVTVERRSRGAVLRAEGRLSVLIREPVPLVLSVGIVDGPVEVQRRDWLRVHAKVPVTVVCHDADKPLMVRSTTLDLSPGGCLVAPVKGLDELDRGGAVELQIDLPTEPVVTDAVIVRSSPSEGIAFRFVGVPEAVTGCLTRYVFQLQLAARRPRRGS